MNEQRWYCRLAAVRVVAFSSAVILVVLTAAIDPAHAGPVPIATITGTGVYTADEGGGLDAYASGVGGAFTVIDADDRIAMGFEMSAMALAGDARFGGERVYDLGLSFIASSRLDGEWIAPFIVLGLDLTGVGTPAGDQAGDEQGDDLRRWRVLGGVHAGGGVHGMLGRNWYWRGQAGFVGAGRGGVTGQLGMGYVFR